MKRWFALALLLVLVSPASAQAQSGDPLASLVAGNTRFGLSLYGQLRNSPDLGGDKSNLVFSPFNISAALAMTFAGAAGQTKAEMAKTLNFDLPDEKLHPAFGQLQAKMRNPKQLSLTNALWLQKNFQFRGSFLKTIKDNYGDSFNPVDFAANPEGARKEINRFVEKATQERIKDLLAQGDVNALTRLVLTSAIYFKAAWLLKFDPARTAEADFHLDPASKVKVRMMRQGGDSDEALKDAAFHEDRDVTVLGLPYEGRDFSMIILLPRKLDGLAELEASLTPERLSALTGRLRPGRVAEVLLPKFEIKTPQIKLKEALIKLGMRLAFTDGADLSGLREDPDLKVTGVFHKAFAKVDEEGTTAAAATAVVVGLKSIPPQNVVFLADHPFLFLIRHDPTGSLLFLGRVVNPLK